MRKNKELERNVGYVAAVFTNGNPISSGVLITRLKRKLYSEGYTPGIVRHEALRTVQEARKRGLVKRTQGEHKFDVMYELVREK